MRRTALAGVGEVVFAAGAATGYGVSALLDEEPTVTDAEEDRLVAACAGDQDAALAWCTRYVDWLDGLSG